MVKISFNFLPTCAKATKIVLGKNQLEHVPIVPSELISRKIQNNDEVVRRLHMEYFV